jgi:hypothetical protein
MLKNNSEQAFISVSTRKSLGLLYDPMICNWRLTVSFLWLCQDTSQTFSDTTFLRTGHFGISKAADNTVSRFLV